MNGHFWCGARCFELIGGRQTFPFGVTATSDVIKVRSDQTNKIPDKSWMLYLLELFDTTGAPMELNLIAQFNNMDNFWAIFGGINRYKFVSVLPKIGHKYLRLMELVSQSRKVRYSVEDQNSGEKESFEFAVPSGFAFEASGQFTGLEWWNRTADCPFPLRFEVEISSLRFKANESWKAYRLLIPDTDKASSTYPVKYVPKLGEEGGIAYTIQSGETLGGLSLSASTSGS